MATLSWLVAAYGAEPLVVDVNGSLYQAVQVLQARHGTPVDLDLAPPDHTYDEVVMDGPHGLFVVERVRGLRFDYEGGIDEGLAAALAAWEDAGGPGGYRVERTSWGRRVIATERTGLAGARVPHDSPLDCRIREPALVGTDGWLAAWIVADLDAQCDRSVANFHDGGRVRPLSSVPFEERPPSSQDPDHPMRQFRLPEFSGSARDRLDQLARVVDASSYLLTWELDRPVLRIVTSSPEDEVVHNRASVTGLGTHRGPIPVAAPSARTYADYRTEQTALGARYPEPGQDRIPDNPWGFLQPDVPSRPVAPAPVETTP